MPIVDSIVYYDCHNTLKEFLVSHLKSNSSPIAMAKIVVVTTKYTHSPFHYHIVFPKDFIQILKNWLCAKKQHFALPYNDVDKNFLRKIKPLYYSIYNITLQEHLISQ